MSEDGVRLRSYAGWAEVARDRAEQLLAVERERDRALASVREYEAAFDAAREVLRVRWRGGLPPGTLAEQIAVVLDGPPPAEPDEVAF